MLQIFFLHGLGANAATLWPLATYIALQQPDVRIHRLSYHPNVDDVQSMVDEVHLEMLEHASLTDEVILVGHSMGGVVSNSLHTKGWNIKLGIYIGSPLTGARILHTIDQYIPTCLRRILNKRAYDMLRTRAADQPPPHPYKTVSMSWPGLAFDGRVHADEAQFDPDHHTHFRFADHCTFVLNPKLWNHVDKMINEVVVQ